MAGHFRVNLLGSCAPLGIRARSPSPSCVEFQSHRRTVAGMESGSEAEISSGMDGSDLEGSVKEDSNVELPKLAPVESVLGLPEGKVACFMHSLGRCKNKEIWDRGDNTVKNRSTLVNGNGELAPVGALLLNTTGFTDEHLGRCKRGSREPLYLCRTCKSDFDRFLKVDDSSRYNLDVVNVVQRRTSQNGLTPTTVLCTWASARFM